VAIYTLQKIHQLGGKVIAMSDSNGVIVDEKGCNIETIKQLKEVERRRIKDYCDYHKHAKYVHAAISGIFRATWRCPPPHRTRSPGRTPGSW